MLLEDGVLA